MKKRIRSGRRPRESDHIELTGIILKGRYCILERIGGGGEGSLYLARDLELGVLRAVKELPLAEKREAKLLRLLEHPCLPRMVDYAERKEYCYLVMEYIKGSSLGQELEEGRVFLPEEILKIGRTLLEILAWLHSRNPAVYYGDLKPDNIMKSASGSLYLVDFGSAVLDYGGGARPCKGTKGYAAPEQYEGRTEARSDIYALGKTLEKLCGKQKWRDFLRCPGLAWFLFKCCKKNPDKRWKSAAEAGKALSRVHPLKKGVRAFLAAFAAFLAALALTIGLEAPRQRDCPSLTQALSPVTAMYFLPSVRLGGRDVRDTAETNTEKILQRFLKTYGEETEQIRILELLIQIGELQQKAHRAELYYRQLLALKPGYGRGYLSYGRFLCRQKRQEESRTIFTEWKEGTAAGHINNGRITATELKNWKKEMDGSYEKE